jgi:polysaccharide biosynthesis protein PslG
VRAGRYTLVGLLVAVAFLSAQAGGAATPQRAGGPKAKAGVARMQAASAARTRRQLRRLLVLKARKRLTDAQPPATSTATASEGTTPPAPRPAAPAGPYRDRVGVASHTIWYQPAEQLAHLRRMRATGLTWAREDFHWGAVEQRPGVWNWHLTDTFMRNAAVAGVNVLATLAYSAEWAASGPTAYHPPRDPAQYANWGRRVVERYGPAGSFWRENPTLEPRPLRAVEIWNEPWLYEFWRPTPDPVAYSRLVRAAATAIRAADPSVKILVSADLYGMTESGQPVTWFSAMLEADRQLFRTLVDAYSVHAYSQDRSPMDAVTKQLWRFDRFLVTHDLGKRFGADHPVWITEFGWTTYQGHPDGVSEETQALYIRQALRRAHEEFAGVVERSFVYQWGNPSNDRVGAHSLFRTDGYPKPALGMLAELLS